MRVFIWLALAIATVTSATQAEGKTVFETLRGKCGQAFNGKVVRDTGSSPTWSGVQLVLHVRDCSDTEIRFPLHLGDNRSRILVLTKLENGKMRFKHDHRHEDGSAENATMYGGVSKGPSSASQTFPVDQESIDMFMATGREVSTKNVWHLQVAGGVLRYRLTRPSGRDFMMEFDLTNPVDVPPPAWDRVPAH